MPNENNIILEFPANNIELDIGTIITFDNISGTLDSERVTYNGESLTSEIANLVENKADADSVYTKSEIDTALSGKADAWTDITGTLTAGSTSITLSSGSITPDSTIDVYTDIYGVSPTAITVSEGSATFTFDAQVSDLGVKARVT